MLYALHLLCDQLGWQVRGDHAHHRLHDLRHTFIVRSALRLYEQGGEVEGSLPALSIYVGHAKVVDTYSRYVAVQCPPALLLVQQILAIPMKRFDKPLLGFLSREEVRALLAAPDTTTWYGRRDRMLLKLLYNTGARVSELVGIRIRDLALEVTPSVRLHGKGRKQRTVPLWKETVAEIRGWIDFADLQQDQPLLPNHWGRQMTRSNVAERIARAVSTTTPLCPSLRGQTNSPHTLRHATAMHLLQAGVDLTVTVYVARLSAGKLSYQGLVGGVTPSNSRPEPYPLAL